MKWFDGSELPANITVDDLFEQLYNAVSEYPIEKWKTVYVLYPKEQPDPIYVSLWLLYFDSLLAEADICDCIRNSYILEIKQSFRVIGDNTDADLLDKISSIFPADMHIFPDGGYISNFNKRPTDEDYEEGHKIAEKLFRTDDIKNLVKSYLKRRLYWHVLDTVFTHDSEGRLIYREEEYKNCRITLKTGNQSCFLTCRIDDVCHTVPCRFGKNDTELFEKIQEKLQQFIDKNPADSEKDIFCQKLISKYKS